MNVKRYTNELMVAAALLFAMAALGYKFSQRTAMAEGNQAMAKEVAVFEETLSLKKIWGDKRIGKKLDSIRTLVPSSKVQWQQKGKKLTAHFTDLKPSEVNKVITKLLNVAVQVVSLKVKKEGESYTLEIQCKW